MSNKWKDLLLKSGLPLEFEVKERFIKKGCTVWDEFIYTREDEERKEKEFSYDLDVNFWNGCSVDLMVECKYKVKDSNWFFLPDYYAYQEDIYPDDVFYIGDYFVHERFRFSRVEQSGKEFIGPLCLKGIEILDNDYLEINIRKAINQVSYAFIDKFIEAIDEQLHTETFYDLAFIKVPLIITNAKLNLINKEVTIKSIKNATKIEDVATQYNFLIHRNRISKDLKEHNRRKLEKYFQSIDSERAEKYLNHESKFLDSFISYACNLPNLILIMNHSEEDDNYDTLFKYLYEFIDEKHPEAIKRRSPPPDYIVKVEERLKEILKKKNNH